ncbi:hypothetical protein Dimus_005514, partial [Dionaea muscipula]
IYIVVIFFCCPSAIIIAIFFCRRTTGGFGRCRMKKEKMKLMSKSKADLVDVEVGWVGGVRRRRKFSIWTTTTDDEVDVKVKGRSG